MSPTTIAGGVSAAGEQERNTTLTLGSREVHIERPNGLKASRAMAILRQIGKAAPELQTEAAEFRQRYERENVMELDRVQAKLRFPPVPMVDAEGDPMFDEEGAPRMWPSPVDRLTEADWTAAGGVYRRPSSPSGIEVAIACVDTALERAEDLVYRFLALFTIPNSELATARKAGDDAELIQRRAEELLDEAFADELLELAVVCSETVDKHFRRKASFLGDRLGEALRAIGLGGLLETFKTTPPTDSTSTTPPESLRPSSSTDSLRPTTDGPPTPSSDPLTTSSLSSADSSNAQPTPGPQPRPTPPPEDPAGPVT